MIADHLIHEDVSHRFGGSGHGHSVLLYAGGDRGGEIRVMRSIREPGAARMAGACDRLSPPVTGVDTLGGPAMAVAQVYADSILPPPTAGAARAEERL